MRVFLVGLAQDDLGRLRARVERHRAFEIVGEAVRRDVEARRVPIPATTDVVMTSREAFVPEGPRAGAVSDEEAAVLVEELTPREHDVLALLSDGHGNRAIGERLGVSEHTVKFHLAAIFGKLGVSTRTEAVRKGLDLGIIDI